MNWNQLSYIYVIHSLVWVLVLNFLLPVNMLWYKEPPPPATPSINPSTVSLPWWIEFSLNLWVKMNLSLQLLDILMIPMRKEHILNVVSQTTSIPVRLINITGLQIIITWSSVYEAQSKVNKNALKLLLWQAASISTNLTEIYLNESVIMLTFGRTVTAVKQGGTSQVWTV